MNSIRYCIDDIEKKGTNIIIVGWAYSEKDKKVNINIKDMDNIDIKVVQRVDIFHAYHQRQEALNSGFKIKIPFTKKVTMIFTTDDEKLVCKFNTKRKPKPQRISKIKILTLHILSIINPIRIIRLLIGIPYKFVRFIKFLNKNGIKKTLLKIHSKINKRKLDGIGYDNWFRRQLITPKGAEIQKRFQFKYSPTISLVISEISEEGRYIDKLIESILKQTYINWELFIPAKDIQEKKLIEKLKNYSNKENKINIDFETNNVNELLKKTTGDFISLLNSNDLLTIDALFEMVKVINENSKIDFIYSDEDKINEDESEYFDPNFKPDWSPDTFRCYNYINNLTAFSKKLLNKAGYLNNKYGKDKEYDIYLRLTEQANEIYHIPRVLYHNRINETKEEVLDTNYGKEIIEEHLKRIGLEGKVSNGLIAKTYKINYKINGNPKVSIIIPNKDEVDTLRTCINSILNKSTYNNYEIIIVENNSISKEIFNYYEEIKKIDNIKVVKWKNGFNYSAINNFGFKETKGDYIILLNNDIEVISENWIEEMLMYAQREDVGIVGAKLYYPDNTIQHAGVILGIGGVAGHSHANFQRDDNGFAGRLKIVQNLSAVTAACLMIKRSVYEEVNGLNEDLAVAFNDIDFCLKVRKKGYLIVFSPYVEMYHYESKSRGKDDTKEKSARFESEIKTFHNKWGLWIRDPYYNDNLTLDKEDFSLRI